MPIELENKRVKTTSSSKTALSPVHDVTRHIKAPVQLQLYVRAGGRCEFDGCLRYLLEHHLTHMQGNFAQMAHIVAFSLSGPRGDVTDRPDDINNLDNLMLLCPTCHKLIDDNPKEYSREQLEAFKKAHEERIFRLTGTAPDRQTSVVVITSKIGGQTVKISKGEINDAIAPRHAASRSGLTIDVSTFDDEGPQFIELASQKIKKELNRMVDSTMSEDGTKHISLFALGPMPLLIQAGNILGDKIPCNLYQRHRDTQDWTWKKDGEPVRYKTNQLKGGTDQKKIALLLSLSGSIDINSLPSDILETAYIYELTLDGSSPEPSFLRIEQDLVNFRDAYQKMLRKIGTDHGKIERLHLFPAVPAPIAVQCGRELMPKIDPILDVYDNDKRHGGFKKLLEVNN